MYDKLKGEVVKQSSRSSINGIWIELVYKQLRDTLMMGNSEKHLTFTFYHSKNATLNAVGFDNSFLTSLLLNLSNSGNSPTWSMASTNIITSGTPINQRSFNYTAGKLCEALQNNIHPAEKTISTTNQTTLNTTMNETNLNCYNSPPCMHPNCCCPKSHATEDCWTKEREEKTRQVE